MINLFFILLSYGLGSIPFGYVIFRIKKGDDIRNHGSGNIGATNVARVLSKEWGFVVFCLDVLKGFIPLYFVFRVNPGALWLYIIIGIASICGHNWSIFLRGKGGKGVSTSVGVVIGLAVIYPKLLIPLGAALVVWILFFFISRIVSLSSILAAFTFFVYSLVLLPFEFKLLAVILFTFIVFRHQTNIKKLIQGEEAQIK